MTTAQQELHSEHRATHNPNVAQHLNKRRVLPKQVKGFLEGGVAAVVAGVSTHPLDLIKVRMQLLGEGAVPAAVPAVAVAPHARFATYPLGAHSLGTGGAPRVPLAASAVVPSVARPGPIEVTAQILRTQGVTGLFDGVSAAALRQLLYSSSRMGIYEVLKTSMEQQERQRHLERGDDSGGGAHIPVYKKVGAALCAGAIGASIGNPADLAMVRMQADGRLPVEAQRNYKGVGDALIRITKEEGVLSLWKGCGPTVYRAMAVTAGQLAAYDQVKETILQRHLVPDGAPAHVAAAFTAAIVASLASNPFDVIKTRLMNMKPDPVTGLAPYNGALDCALKTMRAEGPLALYKGLIPTIARQGPFSLILFMTLEQVRRLFANL